MQNKKAVFFTFVAILLAGIVLLYFNIETTYRLKDKMNVISARVNTLNNFFKDIEKDLSRGLFISGFRSFLAMEEYISTSGVYIDDVNKRFAEAMSNGTVNSVSMAIISNQTFAIWANKITKEALKIGINTNISIINISLQHNDPFSVGVTAYVNIKVNDTKGTALLANTKNISTIISILGFEDPLYTINSNGRVFNIITLTDATNFANITQLKRHLNLSLYIASGSAPDFLMRLRGNLSNSSFGIESLVNVNDFTQQGLSAKSRSNVDYIYFGNQTPTICLVNETINEPKFSWFRLDSEHLAVYSAHCSG